MSAPLPPNEQERLEELRRYALLDTPPEKAFDRLTELAAGILRMPISTVTLIDEDREWFKSCFGLETREAGREFAFCAHAILSDEVMIVPDAMQDERFARSPRVIGPPHIRFYAGAPLRTDNGLNLGTLCVIDTKPRKLSKSGITTLTSLAAFVVAEIQLRYEIGERRRAHKSLRLLEAAMAQSSESVIITTAKLDLPGPEIIFANPAFTELTGYAAEEVIGQTPRLLQGPKTERTVLQTLRETLAAGDQFQGEAINYRKDGSEFVAAWNISPIRDEAGEVTHFIGFLCDATERNRAAAIVRAAHEEAERANRAKGEFISRMSHELRTPLNAILGFAQVLQLDPRTPEETESVEHILSAGQHLLGLVNEVLDLARVEAGHLVLSPEPVSVRETLEESIDLIQPIAAQRDVRLKELTGDLDYEILSTPQRFKQVIINLLSNAVKFNREGGSVAVSCEKVDDCLRIKVADTGRGISPEGIKRLFVPFERLEVEDTVTEGAGLGLSLSKHLIEAMGGKVGVESVQGQGTTFWVELPLVPTAAAGPVEKPAVAAPPEVTRSVGSRTLLYIEDNLSNLRLVERILARRPEITFLSAMQGKTGLELASQHHPNLILLDLHLPDIQGDEVLRQLRASPGTREIPVVMITADATEPRPELGANAYLTKPFNVPALLATINELLSKTDPPSKAE